MEGPPLGMCLCTHLNLKSLDAQDSMKIANSQGLLLSSPTCSPDPTRFSGSLENAFMIMSSLPVLSERTVGLLFLVPKALYPPLFTHPSDHFLLSVCRVLPKFGCMLKSFGETVLHPTPVVSIPEVRPRRGFIFTHLRWPARATVLMMLCVSITAVGLAGIACCNVGCWRTFSYLPPEVTPPNLQSRLLRKIFIPLIPGICLLCNFTFICINYLINWCFSHVS